MNPIASRILVIDTSHENCTPLKMLLHDAGFQVSTAHSSATIMEAIYADPPQCIIMPYNLHDEKGNDILGDIKGDNLYGHLPAVLRIHVEQLPSIDWYKVQADDYILETASNEEIIACVKLCLVRSQRDVNANPLTGLPGNITIIREMEYRLGKSIPFSVAYLDVDHFKPYNDKYGFSRGDEILRMIARILVNTIRTVNCMSSFVGHVGGDDFVLITQQEFVERICKMILRDFDLIVPNFYDEEDRNLGAIVSKNRLDEIETFPVMSCSIAVIDTNTSNMKHIGDISARAAEVKKYAKSLTGSNYVIDRRR